MHVITVVLQISSVPTRYQRLDPPCTSYAPRSSECIISLARLPHFHQIIPRRINLVYIRVVATTDLKALQTISFLSVGGRYLIVVVNIIMTFRILSMIFDEKIDRQSQEPGADRH